MSSDAYRPLYRRRKPLAEPLDVLSSPEAMRQLAESRAAIVAGDLLDTDQLAALMAQRIQPPTDR
jgi:hypothetical protein